MLKRWYIMLLTAFAAILLWCPLSASAAAEVEIYDTGSRLTDKEYKECMERLHQAADKTGMNIGIILGTDSLSDPGIESMADTTYDSRFGEGTDGILYYMDLKGYSPYDYISTSGMAQFYYTNSDSNNRINVIFDLLDDYLYPVGSEDVSGAIQQFAYEVEYYYNEGVPDKYYYYDSVYDKYFYLDANGNVRSSSRKPYINWVLVLLSAFISFGVGIVAALIMFLVVKSRYKFKSSLTPTSYVNKRAVDYVEQYDHFVRTYTTKRCIETDSGGGGHIGGGGGGGHSSGGHGGGGHHR